MRNRVVTHSITVYLLVTLLSLSIFSISVSAYAASSTEVLREGMSNEAVQRLQVLLTEHGFYEGFIDGQFGARTIQAVIDFQIFQGLYPDGIAGQETIAALREADPQVSRDKAVINRKGQEIVNFAKTFLDTPYVWAGSQPDGFDCSGYVYYVLKQSKIDLPRMADEQYEIGVPVKRSQLQEGDLVYFSTYEPGASHVGIYIGGNKFIHASSAANKVTITSMDKQYYVARYVGAKRVVK